VGGTSGAHAEQKLTPSILQAFPLSKSLDRSWVWHFEQ
jgi:hypothetical protein